MDQKQAELQNFIATQKNNGLDKYTVGQQLVAAGWSHDQVSMAVEAQYGGIVKVVKETPLLVNIFYWLNFVLVALTMAAFLISLVFIVIGLAFASGAGFFGAFALLFLLPSLVIAAVYFFVLRKMKSGTGWALIVLAVFNGISILGNLLSLVQVSSVADASLPSLISVINIGLLIAIFIKEKDYFFGPKQTENMY